jgi:hypothetical protein
MDAGSVSSQAIRILGIVDHRSPALFAAIVP